MELNQKTFQKTVAGISLALILVLNLSCKPTPSAEDLAEVTSNEEFNEEGTLISDASNGGSLATLGSYSNQIQNIAASSSCASYSFSGRGKAPAAFIKGMALTFAKSYCRLKTNPTNLTNILGAAEGYSSLDALTLYSTNFSNISMNTFLAGEGPLRSLYTLGIGLGMRESSGKYCEGRDMSASNTSASTAEAGMFQTSYNSITASTELNNLFAEYRNDPSKCFLDVFKSGVNCSTSSISGVGIGAEYQVFNKSCPAFAAEYAMVLLRVRRNHYGPIIRKEAEIVLACNNMLKSVQDYIERDLDACSDVI